MAVNPEVSCAVSHRELCFPDSQLSLKGLVLLLPRLHSPFLSHQHFCHWTGELNWQEKNLRIFFSHLVQLSPCLGWVRSNTGAILDCWWEAALSCKELHWGDTNTSQCYWLSNLHTQKLSWFVVILLKYFLTTPSVEPPSMKISISEACRECLGLSLLCNPFLRGSRSQATFLVSVIIFKNKSLGMWVLGISAVQKKRFLNKNARRLLSHCTAVRGLQGEPDWGSLFHFPR